ncbi:MAG: general secretion pathway protein GspB [Methylococcales bacterium]
MSYILDALRKVEREHRQPPLPGINLDGPVQQPVSYKRGRIIVIILVLLNLAWLVYNALSPQADKTVESITTSTVNKTSVADLSNGSSVQPVDAKKSANAQTAEILKIQTEALDAQKIQAKQQRANKSKESLAELMANGSNKPGLNKPEPGKTLAQIKAQQTQSRQPKPKPVKSISETRKVEQAKPVQTKPAQTKQATSVNKKIAAKPTLKKPKPQIKKPNQTALKNTQSKSVKKPPKRTKQPTKKISTAKRQLANNIPMLRQMPTDFRSQIPQLDINVYVYSAQANSSFVIINMRKYRVGDQVGDNLKLTNIGKDGITLSKNGKKFIIARP